MKLIPVWNSNAVLKNWKTFTEGLEKVCELSAGTESLGTVYNKLLAGELLLWAAYIDDEYCGFCVSQLINDTDGIRHLLIHSLYGKDGKMDKGWYEFGLKQMEEQAKQYGCKTVKFYTVRDRAFAKILEPFGYKVERTLFSKEVK